LRDRNSRRAIVINPKLFRLMSNPPRVVNPWRVKNPEPA
jgi:hypothetical protein